MDWEDAIADVELSHPKDSPEGIAELRAAEAQLYMKFRKEMSSYLESVIRTRKAEDLQSTREQIAKCYEKVGCFLLPHPGLSPRRLAFLTCAAPGHAWRIAGRACLYHISIMV